MIATDKHECFYELFVNDLKSVLGNVDVPVAGWPANKLLGTDEHGNVVTKEPSGNIKTRYEPINKKIFEGKKLWVFGDSITYGVGTTDPYYFPNILAESLGCELTKKGCSGFAFSHGIGDYGNCVTEHMNYYIGKAPGNCDIMLVCFGVNDWTWGRNIEGDRAIGNLYDTTKYTICGAVNLFCQQLQTFFADYPDTKIYFVTPTPTKNAPLSGGSGKSWNQSKTNYNGNTLRDICNAIIQTASLYGYQTLDLNLYFDGDVNDTVAMDEAFPDGLHPNEIGNQKMARTIENLLIANPITTFEFNPLVTELDPLAKSLIYKGNINGEIEEPEEPETPEEPEQATLTSISAKYIGGSVLIGSDLSTLTDVIVTASYSDGTTATVTDYTLSGTIAEGSNTITATYQDKTATFTVYGIPNNLLDNLTLGHVFVNDASGDNLVYDQTTHKLTVGSTGWYKTSYITTPFHVGDEVELLCNFTNSGGTTGNYVSIFTQADIDNPEVLGYFVKSSILGLYASGASSYIVEQQDALTGGSRRQLTPSIPESGVLFNDDKLVLKLTEAGVELYIADVQYTLYASTPLVAGENYYLGLHMNNNGKYGATINYIGTIRE